jgi:hypothetical protein
MPADLAWTPSLFWMRCGVNLVRAVVGLVGAGNVN